MTTTIDNAKWYAEGKGNYGVVLEIQVPKNHISVDPDGKVSESLEEESNCPHRLPGNLIYFKPIPPDNIKMVE